MQKWRAKREEGSFRPGSLKNQIYSAKTTRFNGLDHHAYGKT